MCLELKLIIEVDGYTHHFNQIIENDLKRQKIIEESGYKVIRFTDEQVLSNITGVRMEIIRVINDEIKLNKNNSGNRFEEKSPPPAPASGG